MKFPGNAGAPNKCRSCFLFLGKLIFASKETVFGQKKGVACDKQFADYKSVNLKSSMGKGLINWEISKVLRGTWGLSENNFHKVLKVSQA